jgi:cytochrome oxidase Cu insertion factor (SCO1/SenC/PrrC family)
MKKKILIAAGLAVLLLAAAVGAALYVYPKPQIASATHQPAPDFTLSDGNGGNFTLSSQRGHKVVLYFYRGYW